ncbi:uncharacterized protein [Halyomorpha halys]|uniref:uncharacterized protein n=1 Tax=Halyomorpha halys TaxID=286706 RepID=UPI0006D4DBC7|nr:uncharacterized protein LOC106689844 [Halyomorpha halys]XP_014290518.1 uncharacterized protein LOC106689844 [Halyomorpha halys]
MASSSKRKGSHKVLLEDTIVATPRPQASSTVESKYKMNGCYGKEEKPSKAQEGNLEIEDLALQRRKAALAELERKLECISPYWGEEQPITAGKSSTSLFGDSTFGMSHPSFLKMDILMEESGFTNLHNESDLEHEEKNRLKNSSYLPSSQNDLSFTVQNSKIDPPDFMPTEDSLFGNLHPHCGKKDKEFTTTETKQVKGEIAEELSSLKHDTTHLNRYAPTIEELSSALKDCLNDTDPRKIMEQLLKAGKKKAPIVTEILEPVQHSATNRGPSINDVPVTFEDCLVWGNIEIGHCKQKSLHIVHTQEKADKYKFSILGNNAFKIVVHWPKPSSTSSYAFSSVDHKSSYKLFISFQPNFVGEASGYLIIESESKQTSKKVRLNAFGGKSRLTIHGITFKPLSNIPYLTLNNSLKTIFKLENVGSAPLFFYFSSGLFEESYDIKPKLGFIKPNSHVDVYLSLILKHSFRFESVSSSQETYMDIGSLKIYFGDESTRLRLNKLISRTRGPEINVIKERSPFLACNNYPSSEVTVSLDDPEECFTELYYDGIEKMELIIKAERKGLLLGLESLNQDHYELLSRSQELIVKCA